MVNKEIFQIITNLYKKHPWIGLNEKGLLSLLYDDCKTDEERELIIKLLNDFFYMANDSFLINIDNIARKLIQYNPTETLIYASAVGRETDSSQLISYTLKTLLVKHGNNPWQKSNLYSHMSKSVLYKHNPDDIKNIIIIDEFNGSGQTIKTRYKEIINNIKSVGKNEKDFNIEFIYITSIESAHDSVISEGIKLLSMNTIKQGISSNTNIENKDEAKEIIRRISNVLSPQFLSEIMYPLGYNDSEALYYRETGNVPNSVFPIFWWPEYEDKKDRNQLIMRAI